jgi:uncharacterized protein (TIGR02246 family)
MRAFALLLAAALAGCQSGGQIQSAGHSASTTTLTAQITSQLNRAAADWNRGDLEGFLSDYAADSNTTFIDGYRSRRGIDFIRRNYAPRFAAGARRDTLHFEEITARHLSPALALVTARFILMRGDTVTASGPFTLVMEHRSAGWRILHDHSSSDPR